MLDTQSKGSRLKSAGQIPFGERLIAVPALRWSRLDTETRVATIGEARSTENTVSPSLGLVLELEVVGSLIRGLGMRGGYSWTSSEITRDTSGFAGGELPNAPRHKAELWMRYRVPQGPLNKLMVARGAPALPHSRTAESRLLTVLELAQQPHLRQPPVAHDGARRHL